jgi:hypothetical protein
MRRVAGRRRKQQGWSLSAAVLAFAGLAAPAAWGQQADSVVVAQAGPQQRFQPRLALVAPVPLPGETGTGMQIGLQWSPPVAGGQPVDITAWHRVAPPPDALSLIQQRDPAFGARVEMKIGANRSGLVSDYKFIGLQMDSGSRIGVRRKDGRPTIYYRSQF